MASNNGSVRAGNASRPETRSQRTSKVWEFFNRSPENNNITVCPTCSTQLTARGTDGTSHLKRHPCYKAYLAAAAAAVQLPPAPAPAPASPAAPLVHAMAAALQLPPAPAPAFAPPPLDPPAPPALPVLPVTGYEGATTYNGGLDNLDQLDDLMNSYWYKNL